MWCVWVSLLRFVIQVQARSVYNLCHSQARPEPCCLPRLLQQLQVRVECCGSSSTKLLEPLLQNLRRIVGIRIRGALCCCLSFATNATTTTTSNPNFFLKANLKDSTTANSEGYSSFQNCCKRWWILKDCLCRIMWWWPVRKRVIRNRKNIWVSRLLLTSLKR